MTRRRNPPENPAPGDDRPIQPTNVVDLDEARRLLQEDREEQDRENREHPLLASIKSQSSACAREFVDHFYVKDGVMQFRFYRETWYSFFHGLWQERSEQDVMSFIHAKLEACRQMNAEGDILPFNCCRANISEMVFQMQRICAVNDHFQAPCEFVDGQWREIAAAGKVVTRNTLIDAITLESKTNKNTFIVNGAEWKYDRNAPEPVHTMAFLNEIIEDDELRQCMLEWFGCALAGDTSQQKALILLGPPRAGKGVLLHLLTHLIGPSAVVSPTLHTLSKQFGLENIIDKKVVTVSDARLSTKQDAMSVVEMLLRLIADDYMSVERKFKKQITVRLGVNMILATNELPQLGDNSPAIQSRFLPVPLTKSFLGREDVGLLDRLLPEIPGFALVCLRAYQALKKRGRMIEPAISRAARDEWHENDNPLKTFVEDVCVLDSTCRVEVKAFYEAYRDHCITLGQPEISAPSLSRRLVPMLAPKVSRIKCDGVRYFTGIKIKPRAF